MGQGIENRRRNYFIKQKFQRDFMLKFFIVIIIGVIISGAIIYSMSKSTVTTSFEKSRLRVKSTADFIMPAVLLSSVAVILFAGLATIIITLFTSHRIAGPLYRMEKDMEQVASGDLTVRIRLRHTDEIKALAVSMDVMVQSLRAHIQAISKAVTELESIAESPQAKEKINELKDVLLKLKI